MRTALLTATALPDRSPFPGRQISVTDPIGPEMPVGYGIRPGGHMGLCSTIACSPPLRTAIRRAIIMIAPRHACSHYDVNSRPAAPQKRLFI